MRGVMEEKTSRIAEVMVSSVRPFELMMGKITGIGAVGPDPVPAMGRVARQAWAHSAQGLIPHDTLEGRASRQHASRWVAEPPRQKRR